MMHSIKYLLTALSSAGEKRNLNCALRGTISIRKNGNARDISEDFTTQSRTRQRS